MIDFTVAICTYNGSERISDVLERLKVQINPSQISWEVLVIDNNSTDDTIDIVKQYQNQWLPDVPLRYCFELRKGLPFARRCAIQAAQGNLIGFLDDDNLPAPDWVMTACLFGQSNPQVGAYNGQIHPEFEVPPPPGFERISRFFALVEGSKAYCYNHKYANTVKKILPPGAGIVIRKAAWLDSVPSEPQMIHTSEDLEMLSHIRDQGWEIWFTPELKLIHKIPQSRLTKDYLIKFFQANGLTRHPIRMLKISPWKRPFLLPLYMLNDLRKLMLHYIKHKQQIGIDPVITGEAELLLNILISPFHCWKQDIIKACSQRFPSRPSQPRQS